MYIYVYIIFEDYLSQINFYFFYNFSKRQRDRQKEKTEIVN